MHRELIKTAALQPKYDYSDPISVRKKMRRNIAIAEQAGFWPRQHPDVTWFDEVIPNSSIPVRVYRPKNWQQHGPAVMYLHGGGFVVGDLDTEHPRCLNICAQAQVMVVSIDYRLAPEHPFPAGLDDCLTALDWLMTHGAEWQIDCARMAIVGCSAGGCLTAGVLLARRDRGLALPAFQLLIYPVLDDRLETPSMRKFVATPVWDYGNSVLMWQHYLGAVEERGTLAPYAAPARIDDLVGLPPTYIMTAELDPLCDEAMQFGARLATAGIATEVHQFAGAFHGFDTLGDGPLSKRACAEHYAVLRDALEI